MDPDCSLPFKVGQLAESKSFQKGFRGAWFRCKILEIKHKRGKVECTVEYYDYPDDKIKTMRLYQRPRIGYTKRRKELKAQLMMRPSFPPLYRESEAPDFSLISEVTVIVRDSWKVGDLVDWLCHGCYWSGRITRVLTDDKLQVELPQPPDGEGSSYDALPTELRPTLHWSPELGWIVPFPKGRSTGFCARLVHPFKGEEQRAGPAVADKTDTFSCCGTESSISSSRSPASFPLPKGTPNYGKEQERALLLEDEQVDMNFKSTTSNSSDISPEPSLLLTRNAYSGPVISKQVVECATEGVEVEVSSCALVALNDDLHGVGKEKSKEGSGHEDGKSKVGVISDSRRGTDSSMDDSKPLQEEPCSSPLAPKRARVTRDGNPTSLMPVESIESSFLELEELANKVRWLRGLLKFGVNCSNMPSWKFHEAGQ